MKDYIERTYLSAGEVAAYLGIAVKDVHGLARDNTLKSCKSASGQYRFALSEVKKAKVKKNHEPPPRKIERESEVHIRETIQRMYLGDSRVMRELRENTMHLAVTSPPYFNAKMYSQDSENDLGNIHDLDAWLVETGKTWREVFRVLQPGRKFFLNIMNLPVRENNSFRSLNLVGKSIELCEGIGFIFKRDIVWHKTNGVRAHFGTYPYPGGILLNNMHEFILEFDKPAKSGIRKYAHVSEADREESRLSKEFWLSVKNSDVWTMKPEKSGDHRLHVAPFPLELPMRLIRSYSFVGEHILDPFCGSGTTLIAASLAKRNGVGYELNEDFLAHAVDRLRREESKLL
ncbi:MAG: site-specific DNA-methyltransferase [Alphaproteobacteria bacterium]|nr:site-specific DNA-methyltransferase [Alphaproteobacteria bacterium]MDA8009527.1 site-specific DNA-methyltransferase [Alphaproteobacteria bacterium]